MKNSNILVGFEEAHKDINLVHALNRFEREHLEDSFEIPEGFVSVVQQITGEYYLLIKSHAGQVLSRALLPKKEAKASALRLRAGTTVATMQWRWNYCGYKTYGAEAIIDYTDRLAA